jgi:fimbrial chaperone protein
VRREILIALVAVLTAQPLRAASLEVMPTTIDMPGKGGTAQMRLVNHGDEPVNIQIESFAWTQSGTETLSDSDDIVVSPPFARLDPRGSQIVRLLLAPPAQQNGERSYRIVVTQLPNTNAWKEGAHVLLQFSVPLFAGDGHGSDVTWSASRDGTGLRLEARNSGLRRAKFTNLEIVSAVGAHQPVSSHALSYVLAGATRTWSVANVSPDGLRLEGDDDTVRKRLSIPLEAK